MSFNSVKKRSSAVVFIKGGGVRVYVKGAAELVVKDCTHFMAENDTQIQLSAEIRATVNQQIEAMAARSLRTICIAHRDFADARQLPPDWEEVNQ